MTAPGLLTMVALAGFFPWVSFRTNTLDTQPWFLLLSIIYLCATVPYHLKLKKPNIWMFIFLSTSFLAIRHEGDPLPTIRSIAIYIAAGFSIIVFADYVKLEARLRYRVLLLVNYCWLIFPLLQFIGLEGYFPLVTTRTSESRGFTSLAPEPTFYAIFSLSMMAILWLERQSAKREAKNVPIGYKIFFWLNLVQIFFVAQSSMVILLLAVIFSLSIFIFKTKIAATISLAIIACSSVLATVDSSNLPDVNSRPIQLLRTVLENPEIIITADQSINERVAAIYISTKEAVRSFLVPQGIRSFETASAENYRTVEFISSVHGNKIMSFIGSFIYELGFISLFYFYSFVKILRFNQSWKQKIFWIFSLSLVLLTAVPNAFPLIGYILALLQQEDKGKNVMPSKPRLLNAPPILRI